MQQKKERVDFLTKEAYTYIQTLGQPSYIFINY